LIDSNRISSGRGGEQEGGVFPYNKDQPHEKKNGREKNKPGISPARRKKKKLGKTGTYSRQHWNFRTRKEEPRRFIIPWHFKGSEIGRGS